MLSCAVFMSCCILVQCRSPVFIWHMIFLANTPRSWNFCHLTWSCWMVIFFKKEFLTWKTRLGNTLSFYRHRKKWKQKPPEREPNIFAQANYCHLCNEELGKCVVVHDWWATVCVLTLGTRMIKCISKIYCELDVMLGEIFVKESRLLLAERRLQWHRALSTGI